MSLFFAAAANALVTRSSSSETYCVEITSTPSLCNHPGNCGPSASRTNPSWGNPSKTISSPSKIIVALGMRTTSSKSCPAAANKPINPGLRIVPAVARTSPFLLSSPAGRISCPSFTSPFKLSPSTVAISQRIIPNVLSGITAPVAILTAVPSLRLPFIGAPAFTSPTILHGPLPHTA